MVKFDAFSQNIKTVSNWWNRREASKSSSHFLSADQSLSLGSSSPDQESKDKRSRSEHYKEDARPQNLDESKEILDKHDQKN